MVFAGFTGSVDRIVKLCLKEKWDVVRCDQGNFQVFAAKSDSPEGVLATAEEPLDYWANMDHGKVAFVANPESGGMSLTWWKPAWRCTGPTVGNRNTACRAKIASIARAWTRTWDAPS